MPKIIYPIDLSKKNWVKKNIKKISQDSRQAGRNKKLLYIASGYSDPMYLYHARIGL
jgi:hypothetical protein